MKCATVHSFCLKLILVTALVTFSATARAVDCPLDATKVRAVTEQDGFRFAYDLEPENIKIGEPFNLLLFLCPKDQPGFTGTVRIDAFMPTHGHGMNYKPAIEQIDPGQFRAKGMVLHMPGKWEFRFRLKQNGKKILLSAPHQQK